MKFFFCLISIANILFTQNGVNTLTQFADYNRMSNAQKMEFEEGGTFHFRGVDPNQAIIPDFHLSTKNLIDTLNKNYTTLLRAQVYLNQLKADFIDDKAFFDFAIKFSVLDQNDNVLYEDLVRKNLLLDSKNYKDQLFYKHEEEKAIQIENGNYKLKISVRDLNTGIANTKSIDFSVQEFYRNKLLISDIRFFDSTNMKEIKTYNNTFMNNKGDVILYFDSYKKNTKYQFVYDLEIKKEKKASEKFTALFEDIILETAKFIQSLLVDSVPEDSVFSYYSTILFDDDKAYNRFQLRIPKSEFENFNFFEPNYGQRFLNVSIRPKIQLMNVARSGNSGNDILNVNNMTDSNFVDMTITSDIDEVLIIDSKEVHSALMTISWDSIPNTKLEFYQVFTYLHQLMDEKDVDKIDEASYDELIDLYFRVLKKLSGKENRMEIFSYYEILKKKIAYANDNFFYVFDNGTGDYSVDVRLKTGWMSDKGRIYLKYGLPDEISGKNFIAKDGTVILPNLLAKQKWYYEKYDKEFFFLHNKLVR